MTAPAGISPEIEAVLENGLNKTALTCLHCPSRILNPSVGTFVQQEFALPAMTKQKNQIIDEKHELREFWKVKDMFQFENVGFSNTVDGVKYLTCADCEMGPIGWHDLVTKENFIAVSRVRNS
ncbi:guanine nucleotide exchange factor MSS4 homolog [Frankliniella occidentalis]|uniref:Guanine nucleotide exchange factor MSS4 homolog n=1 Tax=Frankliniella occidentalis TaxID=133901 RepID=A0A6J1RSZ5_FRAOC|nr:guanine nucleotide exchange factor MSS4 homolog [Frankliniella occidentalis]XP_026272032.1 guanine nucleotide exchange factor MSS4 homolog [Frankliniella occidentalis]